MYPGRHARSIHVPNHMIAADGGDGEFTQGLVDGGCFSNHSCGHRDVAQQIQVLGRGFPQAAKHFVAEGNHFDPRGNCGSEGSAIVLILLLVALLGSCAFCACCFPNVHVGTEVDERDVKDHLLAAGEEGHSQRVGRMYGFLLLLVPGVAWGLAAAVSAAPFGRRGLPGASVVVAGTVAWLPLSLVSECSPMLLVVLLFGCWVPRVGSFTPLRSAFGDSCCCRLVWAFVVS